MRLGKVPSEGRDKALRTVEIRHSTVSTWIELISRKEGSVETGALINRSVRSCPAGTGSIINGFGERIGCLELQSVRHASVNGHLQRVIRRLRIRPIQHKESV